MKVGVGISDVMAGMYAATAILAALRHRDATGEGQAIDIALVDTQIAWLINEGTNYLMSGQVPKRRGNGHPNIVPYQVFETADGHAIVAVGNDSQFQRFCALIGLPHLAEDERFRKNSSRLANREGLIEVLAARIRTLKRDELIAGMEKASVPGGPIHRLDDVFASDQVAARDMHIQVPHPLARSGHVDLIGNPIKLSATPVTYRRAPPVCGADTDEVIAEVLGETGSS
jgi:crotonobetainyl-CoA:carnitine CoA-transferase CaiB-like acyl-CoA transferase